VLDDVILLAGHTARSQAYLQRLVAHDLAPKAVIFLGEPVEEGQAQPTRHKPWNGLDFPDLDEPLATTCKQAAIPVLQCTSRDVNTDEVAAAIGSFAPSIVIFSGYGGQIVGRGLLGLGARFLHMHSGRLPEYRGSTTLYYALLNGEAPTVSALLLDAMIDTGPIVARRSYPVPPAGMDLDRIYDPAIRSDLLVRIMQQYAASDHIDVIDQQSVEVGTNYYVIHPVLKHLAILSLDARPD
jgi:methionyl-tRNA formyltransferase